MKTMRPLYAAGFTTAFGSYGFYKSIGYTAGPLLGGGIVWLGGFRLLFGVMTVLALCVAVWALIAVLLAVGLIMVRPARR